MVDTIKDTNGGPTGQQQDSKTDHHQTADVTQPMSEQTIETTIDSNTAAEQHQADDEPNGQELEDEHGEEQHQGEPEDQQEEPDNDSQSKSTRSSQDEQQQKQQPPPMHPLVAHLRAQLYHQHRYLDSLEVERSQYRVDIQSLQEKLQQVKVKSQQREESQLQLKKSYNDHIKSIRATSDDLDSILQKLRQLKAMIRELAEELMEQADPVTATAAIRTFWLNLHDCIDAMGNPLPLHRLRMLTEKFIMDVLILNMNINDFPGLPISSAFLDLTLWFDKYQPSFTTRLRQEITSTVVKTNVPESDTYTALQKAWHKNWRSLYGGLIRAFPFVYQFDKHEPDSRKHYSSKVRRLVERSINLGLAMKGQEVEVTAAEMRERAQYFDPGLMVDEDGQASGIVDFCICPPFVVYDSNRMYPLEKGRVLCSPGPRTSGQEDASNRAPPTPSPTTPIKT